MTAAAAAGSSSAIAATVAAALHVLIRVEYSYLLCFVQYSLDIM